MQPSDCQKVKHCDPDYVDDLMCLSELTANAQRAKDRLAAVVASFGMHFAPSSIKYRYKSGNQQS